MSVSVFARVLNMHLTYIMKFYLILLGIIRFNSFLYCVKSVQIRRFFWSVFHSDWIQRDTYLSVFSPNTVEYGPEETLYLDNFHVVLYIREPVQLYKKVWKMLFSLPQPNLNFVNPSVPKFFGIFYSFPCGDFPKMHCFSMLGKKYFLILFFWRQSDFGTALY